MNKPFVRRLAADIEAERHQERQLLTWVDEAEIRPGHSVPGMINQGLEKSRFVGLVMTPEYFTSASGWTDAEWHAALHEDPDNRRGRIVPILAADCPYIPALLRHLRAIDFRERRYSRGLRELLAVLRDEPLPRPVTLRGQLIVPGGRVDRSTLVAERTIPDADPDVVTERLYCNLLPVEPLPQSVYSAPVTPKTLRSKQDIKEAIRHAQEEAGVTPFVPAFRFVENAIVTFHDLDSPDGPFASLVDPRTVRSIPTRSFIRNEENRKIATSLLNMALDRHAQHRGLVIDRTKQGRYFFPPDHGHARQIMWIPLKRKTARTVAKPCTVGDQTTFWRHLGVYLRMLFLANRYYLKVTPTWVLTTDGAAVKTGPRVGQLVIKWTGPERNLHLLYHVRFWATFLRARPGPILIRAGDQHVEISTSPAVIQNAYGVAFDQKDLLQLLDRAAPLIASQEETLADLAAQSEATGEVPEEDETLPIPEDLDAEEDTDPNTQ